MEEIFNSYEDTKVLIVEIIICYSNTHSQRSFFKRKKCNPLTFFCELPFLDKLLQKENTTASLLNSKSEHPYKSHVVYTTKSSHHRRTKGACHGFSLQNNVLNEHTNTYTNIIHIIVISLLLLFLLLTK